jgi:hypothetical protein
LSGIGDKPMTGLLSAVGAAVRLFSGKSKKFFARVLEAASLEKAVAENDSLKKRINERETIIQNQYFPYEKQFTPVNVFYPPDPENQGKPPKLHPRLTHPMFGKCRIRSGKPWVFDPEITNFDFSGWFKTDRFKDVSGLTEIVVEWRKILGDDVACWKGQTLLAIKADSHPYLKMMYPFIWIARIPKERIGAERDQISYLVTLFLEWASKLTGKNLKTSLSINRIIVIGNKQAYIVFHYDFYDVRVAEKGKQEWKNYYLFRHVVLAMSGQYVYFVSAGEPRQNPHEPTEYAGHIQKWLQDFQLGLED